MMVRFRDLINAKACITASPPFRHCAPTFVPNSHPKRDAGSLPAVERKSISTRVSSGSDIQKEKTTICSEPARVRNQGVLVVLFSG